MGQSIVLCEIKAEVPLENDNPSHQNLLLQRYEERIELLSQEHRVSKFCMDAGFKSVVEFGQYFMTKDTGEQFFAKACREHTLPREDGSSQPKGWIQGNTKIGPVLEVTTSCLYGKHGVEIRIWSLSEDNTQSWVRISHGSNRLVIDSNNNNTDVSDDLPEEQASQLNALQSDLQQSQPFYPFSPESKPMIHEVGNIELCESLDTEPKAQCKVCLSYWDVGIVYCTCGHFLRKGTEENKKFVQDTMDLLSIPNYYIKKGRPHGHRYGKKPGDREYYIAKEVQKRKTSSVSTTDSYDTKSSARTCLTTVELKTFVAKWTTWRTKTTRIT